MTWRSWKGWQELVQMTEFIVVARPESEYRVPAGARVHRLDGLALQVSSSVIRANLAAAAPTPELETQKSAPSLKSADFTAMQRADSTVSQ